MNFNLDRILKQRVRGASIGWWLKQIVPLTYRTRYDKVIDIGQSERSTFGSEPHFVVWRMWLGRIFAVDDAVVAG